MAGSDISPENTGSLSSDRFGIDSRNQQSDGPKHISVFVERLLRHYDLQGESPSLDTGKVQQNLFPDS